MPRINIENTVETLKVLSQKEGGDLHYENKEALVSFSDWATSSTIPYDFLPFRISIFDTEVSEDMVSLTMMINPKDLYISQSQVADNVYTRSGWVTSLWGNQPALLTASGFTAGFYYTTPRAMGGLTNFYRRNSLAYLNLLSVVSFFKNNGYYFMDGAENPTLFKDGTSRVINVMDSIRISYDGSDYIGSFSSFSINDVASNPYRMEYNLEFNVSTFGNDLQKIEGHVKKNNNNESNSVTVAVQGFNTDFNSTVLLNSTELRRYYPADPKPDVAEYSSIDGTTPPPDLKVTHSVENVPKAWGALIDKYSEKYGVDKSLIAGVIAQESRGNQYAKSSAGAQGLMQLMPGTAADLGVTNAWDPEQNIEGGTKYLKQLLRQFNGDSSLALAAYNGGPGRLEKRGRDISRMPAETQDYVVRVSYYKEFYASQSGSE